jgi:hypothetical protein
MKGKQASAILKRKGRWNIASQRANRGRLEITYVLLGEIDRQTLQNLTGVTAEGTKERTVTVHDDETELLVRLEQLTQSLSVELVVTQVERGVNGLEGLEIDVNLALLSFRSDNFTTVDDQAIGRDLVIQLETLLGGGNSGKDGKTVHTRLDVGGSTLYQMLNSEIFGEVAGGPGNWTRERKGIRILQPTSSQRERSDPWGLYMIVSGDLISSYPEKGPECRH